jgi:hypothetical protein
MFKNENNFWCFSTAPFYASRALFFVSRAAPHMSRRANAALFHMLALRRAPLAAAHLRSRNLRAMTGAAPVNPHTVITRFIRVIQSFFCLTGRSALFSSHGPHRICHDALRPRCTKCCPSGRAGSLMAAASIGARTSRWRRLALKLAELGVRKISPGPSKTTILSLRGADRPRGNPVFLTTHQWLHLVGDFTLIDSHYARATAMGPEPV